MKKTVSLLLALAMLVSVLGACGKTSTSSTAASETTASAAESVAATTQAATATPAPATAEASEMETASAVETASAAEPTDGTAVNAATMDAMKQAFISYPLEADDPTISMWYYSPPYTKWVSSNNDYFCIPYAEAATGVKLEFVEVGSEVANEQFNLMIAAGDWTDILPVNEYYTGGLSQAYADNVIQDIAPYVDEYMPNYAAVVSTLDEKVQRQTLVDDMMLSFNTIADGTYSGNGLVTRGDWLQEKGITFSGNLIGLDEFTDLLKTLHSDYDTPYTYYLTEDGYIGLEAAFDTAIPTLANSFMATMDSTVYRVGDGSECASAWISDGYRDYLQWLIGLFDEGVIYKDFLSLSTDRGEVNTATGTGKIAVWTANADKIDELTDFADAANASFDAQAVPIVTQDPNADYIWKQDTSLVTHGMSLSAETDKAELVCQWMNYFWTYDGYKMANYGVEGTTFNLDKDGTAQWLDGYMVNEPQNANAEMGTNLYTMMRFASFYTDNDRLLNTFSDNALEAVKLWTIADGTDERYYPDAITLNTEESDEVNRYQADFLTYAQEAVLKFLAGSVELNDDNWKAYVDTCNAMNLPAIVEVYQNAYDEYVAGER